MKYLKLKKTVNIEIKHLQFSHFFKKKKKKITIFSWGWSFENIGRREHRKRRTFVQVHFLFKDK